MNDVATVNKDKLMTDLKVVIADAEELLRLTADQAGEGVADVRSRVQTRMNQAKADLMQLQEAAVAKVKAAGVRHFVPKPYTAESLLETLAQALQPSA